MKSLSDTQRLVLSQASQHARRLAPLPKLPKAAADAMLKSLLRNGLLAECRPAPREHVGRGWRRDEHGAWIALRITDAGLRAIGVEPDEKPATATSPRPEEATGTSGAEAPEHVDRAEPRRPPALRITLRRAAQAALDAWDDDADRGALAGPMERLRTLLAKPVRPARGPGAPRAPRAGTKQEKVLAMLRRPEGASVAQIAEATGWATHTVRGFFAGLKKKGVAVAVLERVRQVGPNKEGAKGSFTIYRIAD
jgi:hypothetical protein